MTARAASAQITIRAESLAAGDGDNELGHTRQTALFRESRLLMRFNGDVKLFSVDKRERAARVSHVLFFLENKYI